jgi:hypothetical protein
MILNSLKSFRPKSNSFRGRQAVGVIYAYFDESLAIQSKIPHYQLLSNSKCRVTRPLNLRISALVPPFIQFRLEFGETEEKNTCRPPKALVSR